MISSEPSVMLVDSDPSAMAYLGSEIRSRLGYKIITAGGCREAVRLAGENQVRIAVVDLDLRDGKGYLLVPRLKAIRRGLHAIVTSSDYSEEAERRSRECGLVLYMTKPPDPDILEAALRTAWRKAPAGARSMPAAG